MTSKRSQAKSKPQSRRASCTSTASSGNSSTGRHRRSDVLGLRSPILGKNFKIPDLYSELTDIELDDTLPYVPIYCHFIVPEIQPIIRPKTPPILTALRAELEEMQLTNKSPKSKPEPRSRNAHNHNPRHQSNKNH
ncbi:WD repeat-containing protein on Y chromosome [Nasonia vitripennis]|uniref:Uncharacterized protein n=1 Tax=Nasonia vitripennis TaxID=7425 RepID=A0A7M7H657_NASVI|nr:WD repeat-containing protein on Y chromosome [Nasonia vitripennis]